MSYERSHDPNNYTTINNSKTLSLQDFYTTSNLSKVGWISHHVDIEELSDITRPGIIVVSFKGGPDVSTLLGNEVSFILSSLTGSNSTNEVTHTQS